MAYATPVNCQLQPVIEIGPQLADIGARQPCGGHLQCKALINCSNGSTVRPFGVLSLSGNVKLVCSLERILRSSPSIRLAASLHEHF